MMLTLERLKEILKYDQSNGLWTWLVVSHDNGIDIGDIAGNIDQILGYVIIKIDGQKYRAHRLAWFYMTGKWPSKIDHIDRNGFNNVWSNLRVATTSQNAANRTKNSRNKSGYKGVSWDKKRNRWAVQICINNKRIHLGRYIDLNEAIMAYQDAAIFYFGDFARVA
jgi:hypothetical protein